MGFRRQWQGRIPQIGGEFPLNVLPNSPLQMVLSATVGCPAEGGRWLWRVGARVGMGGGRRRGGRRATPKTLAMVSRAMRSARWHVGTWKKCVLFVSSAGQWLETADLPLGYLIQWQEASEHARRCSRKCDAARPWPHRRASPPASAPLTASSKPFFVRPDGESQFRWMTSEPCSLSWKTDASPRSYLGPPGGPGGFQVLRGALQIYGRTLPRL